MNDKNDGAWGFLLYVAVNVAVIALLVVTAIGGPR